MTELVDGDHVHLVTEVIDDDGSIRRDGEPAWVVGFRGLNNVVIAFDDGSSAVVPIEDVRRDA